MESIAGIEEWQHLGGNEDDILGCPRDNPDGGDLEVLWMGRVSPKFTC